MIFFVLNPTLNSVWITWQGIALYETDRLNINEIQMCAYMF